MCSLEIIEIIIERLDVDRIFEIMSPLATNIAVGNEVGHVTRHAICGCFFFQCLIVCVSEEEMACNWFAGSSIQMSLPPSMVLFYKNRAVMQTRQRALFRLLLL